ncbi:hypothetical protein E8D34_09270 [Nocardioides sp. GY 10113]|uniref:PucR family transcriptional regulator n=1 Tax=Nocardioides sp. GY 10113 TaxID=2569761 RepID=UPI0010A7F28E|nr:PucR family transcriptional regulator [Nocardioides sp. GY 10113]TIC87838.1 hypothetical protein E8D34_09270 [Nocardioides sp. GY 10113]
MTVTLDWLLGQKELGLTLVASSSPGRPMSWVHTTDAVDPTPWLTGGELVLTTGGQLDASEDAQEAYVRRLAEAGATALGFGVGLRFDRIPEAVRRACLDCDLPLLEVPLPTPFVAISQAVVRRLSEAEVESLQEALTSQHRMVRAAVRGGPQALVGVLSRDLRCHAVVLNEYGVVVATSTRDRSVLDTVAERWRRLGEGRGGSGGAATEHGVVDIQRLRGRSAVVGGLAVVHDTPPPANDRLLINQAAGIVTLQLDWPAELITMYHSLGGTLLDLLLDPSLADVPLSHHLHHFGFERPAMVVLAVVTAPRAHTRLAKVVVDKLEDVSTPHVASRVAGGVAFVILADEAPRLVDLVDQAVSETAIRDVVIGVSGPLPRDTIADGMAPAREAAAAARRLGQRIGWFNNLTVSALLADDLVRTQVRALTAPALSALTDDPSPRDAELVASLEAYLRHNGSWEAAARSLGVHRHTLRGRIERIEALTGLSLDVAESRALLLMGLMARGEQRVLGDDREA